MPGDLLMSISQDERERAVFRSRRMYQTDLASDLATAEDRGRREGIMIGEHNRSVSFAVKLLRHDRPIDEIIDYTGLGREEIERLK